jgi:peptide/nickel transport system substrate-binding protein
MKGENTMRKLVLILLSLALVGAFVFGSGGKQTAPGPSPTAPSATAGFGLKAYELDEFEKETGQKLTFKEAPILKTKVASGAIPSVEKRLPEDILVVRPEEEIGQYGGTWKWAFTKERDVWGTHWYMIGEYMVRYSPDFKDVVPNVAKGWKLSDDAKSVTFYLRKGMKWSDGDPFDVDDVMFWYDDVLQNDDISPTKDAMLMIGGELAKFEKIDTYTFKVSFNQPNGLFVEELAGLWVPAMFLPSHYLKAFHPTYTSMDKIEPLMKEKGFDQWRDFFVYMSGTGKGSYRGSNVERPQIEAWIPAERNEFMQKWERNPYYWKVDTEGNQLPYIDKMETLFLGSKDAAIVKAIAGEVSNQRSYITNLENYTTFMENRVKGDYRIIPSLDSGTNMCTIFLNYSHKDPVLKELFLNKNFRIALSHAINRDEIANLLYKGEVAVSQVVPGKLTPWWDERLAKLYTEFDIDKSNKLLDEIGLKWDSKHEYRLRKDGARLKLVNLVVSGWPTQNVEAQELIKGTWKKIGIELVNKPMGTDVWVPKVQSTGEHDLAAYAVATANAGNLPLHGQVFPVANYFRTSPQWGIWGATGGEEGEEPPASIKRMYDIYNEVRNVPTVAERNKLIEEAFSIYVENLWGIGIVQDTPRGTYRVVKNNFRNIPSAVSSTCSIYHCATWFFKK